MSDPAAILFDLDGTLTQRRQSVERYAHAFAADFADRLGDVDVEKLSAVLVECDRNGYNPDRAPDIVAGLPWRRALAPDAVAEHWRSVYPRHCVLQGDAMDTLRGLRVRGMRLGVVTNGPVRGQERKLDDLDVRQFFDSVVVSDGVGVKKPDPRIFHLALEQLDATPEDSWFVGDHPRNDVVGARDAGLTSFWLPGGTPWPDGEPPADNPIGRLGELIARVDARRER